MAEILCPGVIFSESEFLPVETHFGKCGENMQAMLQSWATQKYRSTTSVYNAMRTANRCDVSGASTMAQQLAQAKADGFTVDYLATNTGMSQTTWRNFLLGHLPKAAVGIEVANGQAFKDYLTGLGEDAGGEPLKFHFVTVFGHHDGGVSPHAGKTLPAGWWVADGDNYVNNTHTSSGWNRHLGGHTLCFYPETVMNAAKPCAALAMYPRVLIAEPKPGGSSVLTLANVSGYFTAGANGAWLCRNGHTVHGAILADYQATNGLTNYGLPLSEEIAPFAANDPNPDKRSIRLQVFERGVRVSDPKHLFDNPPGAASVYAGHVTHPLVLQALALVPSGTVESPAVAALVQAVRAAAPTLSDLAQKATAA